MDADFGWHFPYQLSRLILQRCQKGKHKYYNSKSNQTPKSRFYESAFWPEKTDLAVVYFSATTSDYFMFIIYLVTLWFLCAPPEP